VGYFVSAYQKEEQNADMATERLVMTSIKHLLVRKDEICIYIEIEFSVIIYLSSFRSLLEQIGLYGTRKYLVRKKSEFHKHLLPSSYVECKVFAMDGSLLILSRNVIADIFH
jgi:hypothetical protein